MSYFVRRTCTAVSHEPKKVQGEDHKVDLHSEPVEFEDLRSLDAWILLGDPGSGKTETFRRESKKSGGQYLSARDFITLKPRPEWHNKTLFIDALDETRAGGIDGRAPLDAIRGRLDEMGHPRFRISCRDADWLASSDRQRLEIVAPRQKVSVFRLDPLTDEQIANLLAGESGVADPKAFLHSVENHGLEALLRNPQTLKLLVKATTKSFPESRQDVFQLACEQLAMEPNAEHQAAELHRITPIPSLLDAAGYLCAVQLIADLRGIAILGTRDDGILQVREIHAPHLPLQQALGTRLFSSDAEGVLAPVHRSVAEYLAAKCLASAIRAGVSSNRVLALICGIDGGVVAALRGLHAWLAVHCLEERSRLCDRDPWGVILYGDARNFAPTEKRQILSSLRREFDQSLRHFYGDWDVRSVGSLATPDMVATFNTILSATPSTPQDQALSLFVLKALRRGKALADLGETLLKIVRDPSKWLSLRTNALLAYDHVRPSDKFALLQLARDILAGRVEDGEDSLLGYLLEILFPTAIDVHNVFHYLHTPRKSNFIGAYFTFWHRSFYKKAPLADVPDLLDQLRARQDLWNDRKSESMLQELVGDLLTAGVEAFGEVISTERMLSWLEIPIGHSNLNNDHKSRIRTWLERRPERFQELLLTVVERCRGQSDYRRRFYDETRKFYWAAPDQIAHFWLMQADQEANQEFADFLLEQAMGLPPEKRLPMSSLRLWVAARPRFSPALKAAFQVPDWQRQHEKQAKKYADEERKRSQEWIDYFREELPKLALGGGHIGALHDLARAYYGHLIEAEGETPTDRLANLFGGDQALVAASLASFKSAITRTDLPSIPEIIRLATEDRMHLVRLPCLAGFEELYKEDPKKIAALSDELLAKAIAFRCTEGSGDQTDWFMNLLTTRADLGASVFVDYASSMLKAGKEHIYGVYELVAQAEYEVIASKVLPQLLECFPTRLQKGQIKSLHYLLKAVLRRGDPEKLRKTIAKRLRLRSLDVAQSVCWFACGLIVDPERYAKRLTRYVSSSHERRQHLGEFLAGTDEYRMPIEDLPPNTLGLLISLLGPGSSPDRPEGVHWVTSAMKVSGLVGALIDRLSGMSGASAAQELERLQLAEDLSEWREKIRHGAYEQRIVERETSFRFPKCSEVMATLQNGKPANAADVTAIVVEALEKIARETRTDNSDGYKCYWNLDRHSRPLSPKPEEACRDLLLWQLRDRLKAWAIDVQPEGVYADTKRADIRASFTTSDTSVNLPIEIKRDSHVDLWRAIQSQLIQRYTIGLGTSGRGIYVVFWFGGQNMPNPPSGPKPRSADTLREQLIHSLSDQQKRLISVVVIDCAAH